MKVPSDDENMVNSFTKKVTRSFSSNFKRTKANAEKHYSDESVDCFLETLSHDDRYPSDYFVLYADATVIIGLKQNSIHGRRFSPIFCIHGHFVWQNAKYYAGQKCRHCLQGIKVFAQLSVKKKKRTVVSGRV